MAVSAFGAAFANVVLDALIVERAQPGGLIGRLQSVQWAAICAAAILIGIAGGYLCSYRMFAVTFLLCGLGGIAMLVITLLFIEEPPSPAAADGMPVASQSLWTTVRSPTVCSVCLFCLLFEFNPFSSTVLYLHMTNDLRFSEEFTA